MSEAVQPGRLVSHFRGSSKETQSSCWDDLWKSSEESLWDRGEPSPALLEYLDSNHTLITASGPSEPKRTALVPGCGRGYDVIMLAEHGFDTYGIDFSQTAIEAAEKHASIHLDSQGSTATLVHFVKADFFRSDWIESLPIEGRQFDLVYDYTFLCALVPESRKDWADRMAELVKPGGFLFCLEFPLWKSNALPGPPWGLQGVYWNLLANGEDGLVDSETSGASDDRNKGKFERVQHIKPSRSYKQGRGTDMLSVWRRKSDVKTSDLSTQAT